jgi:NhaA family Na+:H+ antiporter
MASNTTPAFVQSRLLRSVDSTRDHVRGGTAARGVVTVVVYGDYLCPYCRRLRFVIARLREALGERLAYVFRHYPNETAHPGATFIARVAEAAANQGHFWEMHDWLYESGRFYQRDIGVTWIRYLAGSAEGRVFRAC